jgi:hypothetical protein
MQTVLKITNKENNNNKNGTFNNIMLLLLHQIIPIHPFIEYLQPEPEPPPLNSYFILFLFLFIGKITKQKVVLFISDNEGAVRLANAQQPTKRTRHVEMKHFIILQWTDDKFIDFVDTSIFIILP